MSEGRCFVTNEVSPTLDEHHVIPREYGGLNGPTVFLSPTIHQAIHRCAHNEEARAKFLAGLSPDARAKAKMLMFSLELSRSKLDKESKNEITIYLTPTQHDKLHRLSLNLKESVSKVATKLLTKLLGD